METNVLYIRIPVKLHSQIRALAESEGVSITFMAITLLRDAFSERERVEQLAIELAELKARMSTNNVRNVSEDASRREAS